jgi:hypothetical protein
MCEAPRSEPRYPSEVKLAQRDAQAAAGSRSKATFASLGAGQGLDLTIGLIQQGCAKERDPPALCQINHAFRDTCGERVITNIEGREKFWYSQGYEPTNSAHHQMDDD